MSLPVAAFFARRADAGGLSLHHQPVLSERIVTEDLTLEDPHLDAADAVSGVRGGLGIIDVAAQRVQRHPALAIPFGPRDLGAAKTARAGDTNAFGTEAQGRLNRALHGTAEGDAALKLVSDALGDELGVDLRLADLDNVQAHFGPRHARQLFFELLDVGPLLADDYAWARGIDGNPADLGRTLDDDLGDRRLRHLLQDVLADLEILEEQPAVIPAFGKPAAVPGTIDLQAKPDRRGFLTHYASSCSRTITRIWLNGLTMRDERPRARVAKRFIEIDLPTLASATIRASTSRLWLFSALATAEARTLRTSSAIALGENFRMLSASSTLRPRIRPATRLSLRAEPRIVLPIASASLSPTLRGAAGLLITRGPSCQKRGRGTCASARIRQASFRPCLR